MEAAVSPRPRRPRPKVVTLTDAAAASLAECVCGLRWVGYQPRSLLYACAHVDTKAGAVRPGCLVALKVAHPGG